MYEHRSQPLLPHRRYLARLALHLGVASAIVSGSLGIGMVGYRGFEGFSWLDSLLNASMILGGMGPVNELRTANGKLFASFYSLFAGIVFLVAAAVLVAPAIHRLMHRLHMEEATAEDEE